jgi:hypothetical protein
MDNTKPVYNGLHEQAVYLVDTSATSPALFVIKEFPTQLNAGKNLFKLHGHPRNLREDSSLYIEILDYNNEPIQHEIAELSEEDGSVVIVIYIYETTPPGNCTVTVVGEALYVEDKLVPTEWQFRSNVMWQRNVLVNSSKTNTAEIVFDTKPTITIQEQISVQLDRTYDTTQTVIYNTGSVQFISNNDTPTLIVNNGVFTPDMIGGTVTIPTPSNPTPISKYITGSIQFESIIDKVLSTSSILLRSEYLIDPSQSIYGHRYDNFDSSAYSIKYESTPTYVSTENSESYALIEINDLQPISGDIARIKVFSNNSGTIGNWDLLSDVVLGDTEIFITDTGSIEPYVSVGLIRSSSIINTYYESSSFNGFNVTTSPTIIYSNNNLTDALYINSLRDISQRNNVDIVKIKDQYAAKFIKGASYKFTLNAIGTRTIATGNTDPIISFYLSGSSFNTDYTDYFNQELPITVGKRIGYLQCKKDKQRFDDNAIIFNADSTGTGVLYYVIEGGQWEISNIHVTTNNTPGYTPEYTRIRTKIPTTHKSGVQQSFKVEYYNSQGVKSEHSTISDPIEWVGGNHYIDGDHNLITGSIFVADKLTTGIEFAGRENSGMIRTTGYTGFNDKNKGILIWSGSALTGSTTDYKGTGVELYASDDNYFRFATDPSETSSLYVKTETFFLGNTTSSISSNGGNIQISGSIVFDAVTVPTSSYAISSSRTLTASYYAETDPLFTAKSGSLATTGSNSFSGSQIIYGDLTVIGTSSFTYVTSSIVQVGSNIITLNTDNPATRFGGITVVDSGSFGTSSTGSLFWDSQNNRWIYSNPSGSTYDGGMLISGPRNTSGLGNEVGVTNNFLVVGQGADHISSSAIFHSASITQITGSLTVSGSSRVIGTLNADGVQFIRQYNTNGNWFLGSLSIGKSSTANETLDVNGNTIITGSLNVTSGITASLFGTASWSSNAITASYITTSQTASYVLNAVSSSQSTNSLTASYVVTAQTASYFFTSSVASSSFSTNSVSSSLAQTASYVLNAVSASYSTNSLTASYIANVVSSSYAITASYSVLSTTASYAQIANTSSYTVSSSFANNANTASYVLNAVSASYANFASTASYVLSSISSSFASTASYVLNAVSASYSVSSSFATNSATASYINTAQTASYVTLSQTASYVVTAQTASYVLNSVSSSFATNSATASYVLNSISSSFATTASHVPNTFIQGGNSFNTAMILGTNDNQSLRFETAGAVRMQISSSGQVVYGGTVPLILSGGLFEGVSSFMEIQTGESTGAYNEAVVLRHNGISATAATRSLGLLIKLSSENMPNEAVKMGGMILRSTSAFSNSADLHFVTANTEKMTISNAGNVGIGTTSPNAKLDVNGSAIITGSLNVTQGITGSLFGTSSWANNAVTASFVTTAQTASYFFTSSVTSASFATNSSTASYVVTAQTASYFFTSSVTSASFAVIARSVTELNQNVVISGSLSIGFNTLASGTRAHAEGQSTTASGQYSHAEGGFSIASGLWGHAEGISTYAIGQTSHAEGQGSVAFGEASHAEGYYTLASSSWSHTEGLNTTASATAAHAEGYYTVASNAYAHSEGSGTQASGYSSHAEGYYTVASGYSSHAEGTGTVASGDYSHAEGESTQALSKASRASGWLTIASGSYQTVVGQYNKTSNLQGAFIIGNGNPSTGTRSNLVFASGSVFQVTGSIIATAGFTGSFSGSFSGTATSASFAQNSVTASYVLNAVSASFASTSSYVVTAQTASYFLTSSVTSASFATNAMSAVSASNVYINYGINIDTEYPILFSTTSGSYTPIFTDTNILYNTFRDRLTVTNISSSAITSSLFGTSSWSNNAITASYFFTSSVTSASFSTNAVTASYVLNAVSSSFSINAATASYFITSSVTSASFAQTASFINILNQNVSITGSLNVSSSITASAFVTRDALITSTTLTANSGITTIYSIPTASYDGAWFDYTIRSGSNARAGTIFGMWSGSAVNYAENATTDFGSTANFVFGMSINGANMILSSSATTNGWTVNSIIRSV